MADPILISPQAVTESNGLPLTERTYSNVWLYNQQGYAGGSSVQIPILTRKTYKLYPYSGKRSAITGMPIPDLSRFRAPPASYPHKDDPTIPLDYDFPIKPKRATRYGGLTAGGNGQWDWIAWRRLVMWNCKDPPPQLAVTKYINGAANSWGATGPVYYSADWDLLSAMELEFIKQDRNHSAKSDFANAMAIITTTFVAAGWAVGIGAIALGAAGPAAAAGAGTTTTATGAGTGTIATAATTEVGAAAATGGGALGTGTLATIGTTAAGAGTAVVKSKIGTAINNLFGGKKSAPNPIPLAPPEPEVVPTPSLGISESFIVVGFALLIALFAVSDNE